MISTRAACATLVVLLCFSARVFGVEYRLAQLGSLSGGLYFTATAISSSGYVAGYWYAPNAPESEKVNVFEWSLSGGMTNLGRPQDVSGWNMQVLGVNATGSVVLDALSGGYAFGYVVTPESNFTRIEIPGTEGNLPVGISDAGEVAGYSTLSSHEINSTTSYVWTSAGGAHALTGGDPLVTAPIARAISPTGAVVGNTYGGVSQPFLWSSEHGLQLLPTLPAFAGAGADAISSNGIIAGGAAFNSAEPNHAVMWPLTGGVVDLGVPAGTTESSAVGVNALGQVIVQADDVSDPAADHAYQTVFIYTNGANYDLNSVLDSTGNGWTIQNAVGINDSGWIAGNAMGPDGNSYPVLLTPDSSALPVSTGANQIALLGGGAAAIGGGNAELPNVTAPGTFNSSYQTATSQAALQTGLGAEANGIRFGLVGQNPDGTITAGSAVQFWDLHFDGAFTGAATVTLHYDPTLTGGVDPAQFQIWHFTGGDWVPVANEIVDPVADTITFTTDSFSPFVLGVAVPEPSAYVLAVLGALGFGRALWRRHRRR